MLLFLFFSFFFSSFFNFFFIFFFFFNDTATTEIYTLSLHDALPIADAPAGATGPAADLCPHLRQRSEEHTSELQSRLHLVCRLLLEKKKKNNQSNTSGNKTKNTTNKNSAQKQH